DIATLGVAQVSVFTPSPGGGTSSSLSFAVNPPPAIAISAASVQAGGSETAMLTNGFGGIADWIALAATSAPDTNYLQYVYVGSGVTTRTWTVTMPTAPGTYEVRLFLNNGYTRVATSPTITVTGSTAPPPALTISAASVAVGGSETVTLTNAPGGAY